MHLREPPEGQQPIRQTTERVLRWSRGADAVPFISRTADGTDAGVFGKAFFLSSAKSFFLG